MNFGETQAYNNEDKERIGYYINKYIYFKIWEKYS
jgi:hypothetical protein